MSIVERGAAPNWATASGFDDDGRWAREEKESPEVELMLRVARLYFFEEKTKTDIAAELGTTRQRVDVLLKSARAKRLVSITLSSAVAQRRATGYEEELRRKFIGLRRAIVVPPPSGGVGDHIYGYSSPTDAALAHAELQLKLAEAGGEYLGKRLVEMVEQLPPNLHRRANIIMGGGRLVYASVRNVHTEKSLDKLDIFPLSGFFNNRAYPSSPHGCCRELQSRVGGQNFWLPCPALARQHYNPQTREVGLGSFHSEWKQLVSLPLVSDTLHTMTLPERPCLVVTNIAPISATQLGTTIRALYPKEQRLAILRQFRPIWALRPPVGRIVGLLFDKNGHIVDAPWSTIGASFRLLSDRVKHSNMESVVIAGGDPQRILGVRAMLRANLVTTLITDEHTAKQVLEDDVFRPQEREKSVGL